MNVKDRLSIVLFVASVINLTYIGWHLSNHSKQIRRAYCGSFLFTVFLYFTDSICYIQHIEDMTILKRFLSLFPTYLKLL